MLNFQKNLKNYFLFSNSKQLTMYNNVKNVEKIKTTNPILDLTTLFISKCDFIMNDNYNMSIELKKESYSKFNDVFFNTINECNIECIIIMGSMDEIDMFKGYFSLYKKYNNMKIEYYINDKDSFVVMYDSCPFYIDNIELNKMSSMQILSPVQVQEEKEYYIIHIVYKKMIHNAFKFNFKNDIKSFMRKTKLENISKMM